MKLTVLFIATNAIIEEDDRTTLNRSLGSEWSKFSDELTERRKPQIDDIYYNENELQRLINQGVDVSNFMVANGIESGKKRIGKKFSLIQTFINNLPGGSIRMFPKYIK